MKIILKNKMTIIILIISIISLVFFCSIAYSAFSSTMNISGFAHARVEADVRITDFSLYETRNATSLYEDFGKKHISSSIDFQDNSFVIYNIEVTNYGQTDVGIYDITGLPSGVSYELIDYNLKDKLCDSNNKCNNFSKKNFYIKLMGSNIKMDFTLNFEFKVIHNISYINFSGDYKNEVYDQESISIDISNDSPKFIYVDANYDLNYTYKNNIITLNNVLSNVSIYAINDDVSSYSYTGDVQEFTTLYDGVYKIELWGSSGVDYSLIHSETVGSGGYTSGKIYLTKGTKLYVYVGSGDNSTFNGAGPGEAPGGGATDVRLVNGSWDDFNSLKSRIMVAGAGGGGVLKEFSGIMHDYEGDSPGHGGGLSGYDAYYNVDNTKFGYSGYGASQISGGFPGMASGFYDITSVCYGRFGFGGYGLNSVGGSASSGAGSGYYGGGHGVHTGGAWTGAGGGSSFISGHNGCDAIEASSVESNIIHSGQSVHYSGYKFYDTVMIDGAGYNWTTKKENFVGMPTKDGTGIMTGNRGNGYAKISLIQVKGQHSIKYENIVGDYQVGIYEGEDLIVDFGDNAPDSINITMGNYQIDYSYYNGVLKLYNVRDDVIIQNSKAIDLSGNNKSLILANTVFTPDGLSFDGVASSAKLPDDIGVSFPATYSLKFMTHSTNFQIIFGDRSTNAGFGIYAGNTQFLTTIGGDAEARESFYFVTEVSKFYNIDILYESLDNIRLFVDGEEVLLRGDINKWNWDSLESYIGRRGEAGMVDTAYFNGVIEKFIIYDDLLTEEEIKYNISVDDPNAVIKDNLKIHYYFK